MSNLELVAKISGDLLIEVGDPTLNISHEIRIDATLPDDSLSPCVTDPWFKCDEGETTTERQVDERQRAIGNVHRSDSVEILWDVDRTSLTVRLRIGEFNGIPGCPLAGLQKCQQLAEYLCGVASIYLLYYYYELRRRESRCCQYRFHEDSVY